MSHSLFLPPPLLGSHLTDAITGRRLLQKLVAGYLGSMLFCIRYVSARFFLQLPLPLFLSSIEGARPLYEPAFYRALAMGNDQIQCRLSLTSLRPRPNVSRSAYCYALVN